MSGNEIRVKKLRWKARRGMKELDVLLESFFEEQGSSLASGDWPQLEDFLDREDDVLFDWISGRDLPSDPGLRKLIKVLTHAS